MRARDAAAIADAASPRTSDGHNAIDTFCRKRAAAKYADFVSWFRVSGISANAKFDRHRKAAVGRSKRRTSVS